MLKRLKDKWNVDGTKLFLILCVFAITGSVTAFITRQVTTWMELGVSSIWYWLMKLAVLVFGYQVIILMVAIPFGQFRFFLNFEKKIWRWFAGLFRSRTR